MPRAFEFVMATEDDDGWRFTIESLVLFYLEILLKEKIADSKRVFLDDFTKKL